jgi:hypothetical protein
VHSSTPIGVAASTTTTQLDQDSDKSEMDITFDHETCWTGKGCKPRDKPVVSAGHDCYAPLPVTPPPNTAGAAAKKAPEPALWMHDLFPRLFAEKTQTLNSSAAYSTDFISVGTTPNSLLRNY